MKVELKKYMAILRKRVWLIIAIVLFVSVVTGIKSLYFTTPVYEATAKLIVNQTIQSSNASTMDYGAVQTNIALINSYKEIIKTSAIMDEVIRNYPDLGISSVELSQRITVTSSNDSQVMGITSWGASYYEAAKTVNAISKVFQAQIPKIMKVNNVTILSEANSNEPAGPINGNPLLSILISFVAALALAVGLVFLLDYLDDTFKSEEDIQKELGLPTLAVIGKVKKEDIRTGGRTASHKQAGEAKYVSINQ